MLQRMAVYVFSDGISRAMPFLVLPIIAGFLSVADFGLVTNFTVLVELFAAFVSLSAAFSLAVDYYKVDKATLLSNLIVMITALFVFAFLVIVFFNGTITFYLKLELKWQIYALLTAYFNSINQLYNTKLRFDEKAKQFGLMQFIRSGVSSFLSLFLIIVLNWSWEGRAFSLLITGLIIFTISIILLRKEKMIFHNVKFSIIKKPFLFGFALLPQTASQWLRGAFEKILVTKQIGLASNGLLSFSTTIGSIYLLFSSAFFASYTPILYKSLSQIEKEPENEIAIFNSVLKKALYFFSFLLATIIIGFFGLVFLINHFFKKEYHGAEYFMPFVLLAVFFSAVTSWLSSFLMFRKKTKLLGIVTIIQTAIQALLTYFMVSKFETIGALYGNLLGSFILALTLYYFVKKRVSAIFFTF